SRNLVLLRMTASIAERPYVTPVVWSIVSAAAAIKLASGSPALMAASKRETLVDAAFGRTRRWTGRTAAGAAVSSSKRASASSWWPGGNHSWRAIRPSGPKTASEVGLFEGAAGRTVDSRILITHQERLGRQTEDVLRADHHVGCLQDHAEETQACVAPAR